MLVDDVRVQITKEGWLVRAIDPAHVAMVELNLKKSSWEIYKAILPCNPMLEIGLDLDKILGFIKTDKRAMVSIELDMERNRIHLNINNVTKKSELVDMGLISDPKPVNIKYETSFITSFNEIAGALKATKDNNIAFVAHKSGIVKLYDHEGDKAHRLDVHEPSFKLYNKGSQGAISVYPLGYLESIYRKGQVNGTFHWLLKDKDIICELADDGPLHISAVDGDNWTLDFILAPFLSNEEIEKEIREKCDQTQPKPSEPQPEPVREPEPAPEITIETDADGDQSISYDPEPAEPRPEMHPIPAPVSFEKGQRVKSVAGELFTVMEVFQDSMTVRDKNGGDFDGLFETFTVIEGGV